MTGSAKISGMTQRVACTGGLRIDGNHTTEDIGIVMGLARRLGATVVAAAVLVERFFLAGRAKLDVPASAVLTC